MARSRFQVKRWIAAGALLCLIAPPIPCRTQNKTAIDDPADALIKEALKDYQSGQLAAALRKLQQAKTVAAGNAYVRLYLGLMLYEQNPADTEAQQLMESVLDQFPTNPDLHLRLLDSYLRSKKKDRIAGLIDRSQQTMESNRRFALNIIYTLVGYGQLELARRELDKSRRALEDKPQAVETSADAPSGPAPGELDFVQGLIAAGVNQKDEALKFFREADRREFPPQNSLQMRMLADALSRLEEFSLSAQAYAVYLLHFPQDQDARLHQAVSYLSYASFARAQELLRRVLKEAPLTPQANYYLGLTLVELKKNDEARRYFELELKNDPGSFQSMAQLAMLAYMQGNDDRCRQWLEKAAALDPEWVETQYAYGLLYNREGKYEQAIHSLEEVVRQVPNHMKAQYHLSIAYLRSGNDTKAKEHRDIYERLMEAHKAKSLGEDTRRK